MNLSRRQFLKLTTAITGTAGLGSLSYGHFWEASNISIEKIQIPIKSIATGLEGFKIALLSDFHLHPFTTLDLINEAVEKTNALKPDVVLLTGDFIDAYADAISELAPALARLNATHGIFAVLGNHDCWKGKEIVHEGLRKENIPVFINEGVTLSHNNSSLYLAGLDDVWTGRPNISRALQKRRGDIPTVLMVHEPDYADAVARDKRIHLQLSGHSHGGQVRLPFIGALSLPSWGNKYDQGYYRIEDLHLYTNRGLGTVDLPIRFNCPPEITELTLTA